MAAVEEEAADSAAQLLLDSELSTKLDSGPRLDCSAKHLQRRSSSMRTLLWLKQCHHLLTCR